LRSQSGDARFHGVVRDDQPAHVVRPLRGELRVGAACLGKAFDPVGQGRDRAGDAAQDQRDDAAKEDVDEQRLQQQAKHDRPLAHWHEDARDQPLTIARAADAGDHDVSRRLAIPPHHAARPVGSSPCQVVGADRAAHHHDIGHGEVLIGEDTAKLGLARRVPPVA
jgi:hypothetical protein